MLIGCLQSDGMPEFTALDLGLISRFQAARIALAEQQEAEQIEREREEREKCGNFDIILVPFSRAFIALFPAPPSPLPRRTARVMYTHTLYVVPMLAGC